MPWSSGTMKLIGKTSADRNAFSASIRSEMIRKTRRMAGSRNDCVLGRLVSATS